MSKLKPMTPLPGQEEIFEAILKKDVMKLWDLVKYVGYSKIESPNLRMLILYNVYKKFDPTKNNNFITYYDNVLNHTALNMSKASPFTSDKRALKDVKEHSVWPSYENAEPINQNSNILRNFSF